MQDLNHGKTHHTLSVTHSKRTQGQKQKPIMMLSTLTKLTPPLPSKMQKLRRQLDAWCAPACVGVNVSTPLPGDLCTHPHTHSHIHTQQIFDAAVATEKLLRACDQTPVETGTSSGGGSLSRTAKVHFVTLFPPPPTPLPLFHTHIQVRFAAHDLTAVAPPVDTTPDSHRLLEEAIIAIDQVLTEITDALSNSPCTAETLILALEAVAAATMATGDNLSGQEIPCALIRAVKDLCQAQRIELPHLCATAAIYRCELRGIQHTAADSSLTSELVEVCGLKIPSLPLF